MKPKEKLPSLVRHAETRYPFKTHWDIMEDYVKSQGGMMRCNFYITRRHKMILTKLKRDAGKSEADCVREGLDMLFRKFKKEGVLK